MTGISIFNGAGQAVADFSIASGSGTLHDASGAHPIPEPSGLVLVTAGVLSLLLSSWRHRKLSA